MVEEQKDVQKENDKKDQSVENVELIKKKKKLMETYPSICFTSKIRGQEDDSLEISVNQKFLSEIGYSTDSFASTVLHEGLPQLFSYQNDATNTIAKFIMENFFISSPEGLHTQEFEAPLLLKSGYVN